MSGPPIATGAPIAGGCAAILLAGGRGSRMGGVEKPLLEVAGRSMLATALAAAASLECEPVVVAAPILDRTADRVVWVREEPALSGPAAGIVAALAVLEEPLPAWTLVLACDLPGAVAAASRLREGLESVPRELDGRCLSLAGRAQWLCGIYRTERLRAAAALLPAAGAEASVRALLGSLALEELGADAALAADVDTWDDLEQARARADAARTATDSQEEAP